tara:strand:- start:367 stop:1773 length:1407 start_codon:yes stop_codon:yes gene_type:complete
MFSLDIASLLQVDRIDTNTACSFPDFLPSSSQGLFYDHCMMTFAVPGCGETRLVKDSEVFTTRLNDMTLPVYARVDMRDGRSFDWFMPCCIGMEFITSDDFEGYKPLGLTTASIAYPNDVIGHFGVFPKTHAFDLGLPRCTREDHRCWILSFSPDITLRSIGDMHVYVGGSPLSMITQSSEPNCKLCYGEKEALLDSHAIPLVIISTSWMLPGTPLTIDFNAVIDLWRKHHPSADSDGTQQGPLVQTHDRFETDASKRNTELYDMQATILSLHCKRLEGQGVTKESIQSAEAALSTALAQPFARGAGALFKYNSLVTWPEVNAISPLANPWMVSPALVPSPIGNGAPAEIEFSPNALLTDNLHPKSPLADFIVQFVQNAMTPPDKTSNSNVSIVRSDNVIVNAPLIPTVEEGLEESDLEEAESIFKRARFETSERCKDDFMIAVQKAAALAMTAELEKIPGVFSGLDF